MNVVVINYWGGVPAALRENVARAFPAALTVASRVHLSFTNTGEEFWHAFSDVWPALRRAGYSTACFGAVGSAMEQDALRRALRDPRARLRELGVDRCSLFDGALYVGTSAARAIATKHRLLRSGV